MNRKKPPRVILDLSPEKFKGSWEPKVYEQLRSMNLSPEYEPDKLKYTIEATYTPDFKITLKNGKEIYLEAKGYWDAADRRKLKAVLKNNPDKDIRMVFQADSKIHKASPSRYSDWCDKHNIPYVVKNIPEDWFE